MYQKKDSHHAIQFDFLLLVRNPGKSTGKLTELELSTSYEIIVEKHGGQIECISGLEQSTEFIIKLPI
jgi:signal transduction histidine kinase